MQKYFYRWGRVGLGVYCAVAFMTAGCTPHQEQPLKTPRALAEEIILVEQGRPDVIIVYGRESKKAGELVQRAIRDKSGVECDLVSDNKVSIDKAEKNLIILGNLATNKISEYLYLNLYTAEDRYFPGDDGFVVRCLIDPLGKGRHIVVLGGSTGQGVTNAAENFIQAIEVSSGKNAFIKPYLKVQWGQNFKEFLPNGMKFFPWKMTGGRGPLNSASSYLLSGDEKYALKYKEALLKYLKKPGHLYSYYGTMLWGMMEACGVFSDQERLEITNKLLKFLRSNEGYDYHYFKFYKKEWQEKDPDTWDNRVVGNHNSRAGMGFYFGYRYFKNYFNDSIPAEEFADWEELVNNLWGAYLKGYRNYDEAYSQHGFGGSLDNTLVLSFILREFGDPFYKQGLGRKMGDYVFSMCNSWGKTPDVGDGGGVRAPANLLSKLAYAYKDGRYIFMANKAGGYGVSTDEPFRGFNIGLAPVEPTEHLGVFAVGPFSIFPFPVEKDTFDKMSFRGGFDPSDAYLLVDGVGGFSHAYNDQNSIAEYSQFGYTWICQPDAFFYPGLNSHNALTYTKNGIAPSETRPGTDSEIFMIARLSQTCNTKLFSFSKTFLPDYGRAAWRRYILFFRSRGPFLVLDVLDPDQGGFYKVNFHWNVLGDASLKDDRLFAEQKDKNDQNLHTFNLVFAKNTEIQKRLVEDNARKKIMLRTHFLGSDTRFYSCTLTRTSQLAKAQPLSMLSVFQSWKEEPGSTAEVLQISETAYVVKVSGEDLLVAVAGPDKGTITCGGLETDADFMALSPQTAFLSGAERLTVNDKRVFDFKQKTTGEFIISNPEIQDMIRTDIAGQIRKIPLSTITGTASHLSDSVQTSCMKFVKTGNQTKKIVLGNKDGLISLFDAELNNIGSYQADSAVLSLAVYDFDNDGTDEIIAGTDSGGLYCLGIDLTVRWQIKIPRHNKAAAWYSLNGPKVKSLFVEELDETGGPMIFAGMGDSTLQAIDSKGKMLWNRLVRWGVAHLFVSNNFFSKGQKSLVTAMGIVSPTTELYVIKSDGTIQSKSRTQKSGYGSGVTILKDIKHNGENKIISAANNGTFGLYSPNRAKGFSADWTVNLGQEVTGAAVLSSSKNEKVLMAASKTGILCAFSLEGDQLWFRDMGEPIKLLKSSPGQDYAVGVLANNNIFRIDADAKSKNIHDAREQIIDIKFAVQAGRQTVLYVLTDNGLSIVQLGAEK